MRGRRILAVLMAFALLAAACSSGDSVPEQATEPPVGSSDDSGGTETTDDGAPEEPAEATPAPTEPPAPAPSGIPAPPDPTDFLPYAPVPEIAEPPAAEATAPQHIAAMFLRVAQEVLGDRRAADAGLISEFDSSAPFNTPDLVLAAVSAASSISVETFSVVEAYATVGAAAGYDPAFTEYFTVRADAAAALGAFNALIYQASIGARAFGLEGKTCVVEAILENRTSCEDDAAADQLIADLVAATDALEFPEAPDEPDDHIPDDVDFCALWAPVMVELGTIAPIFELLVADALLDSRFLGRADCRVEAGGDEELVWGPQQATDAYTTLYAEVVAVSIPAPFDEAAYDNDPFDVLVPKERDTITAQLAATSEAATGLIGGVAEPRARLGLIVAAYLGAAEVWWQDFLRTQVDGSDDETDAFQLIFECAGPDFDRVDTDCSTAERAIIDTVRGLDLELSGNGTSADGDDVVAWEDVQAAFPLCDIWAAILVAIPPDQAQRIDFQVNQLGTEDILGMVGCDTGIAQSGDAETTSSTDDESDG